MSEGEERGGKFKEISLIKRESTTRGGGINQSFALMRHLLIMPGRETAVVVVGASERERRIVGIRANTINSWREGEEVWRGGENK